MEIWLPQRVSLYCKLFTILFTANGGKINPSLVCHSFCTVLLSVRSYFVAALPSLMKLLHRPCLNAMFSCLPHLHINTFSQQSSYFLMLNILKLGIFLFEWGIIDANAFHQGANEWLLLVNLTTMFRNQERMKMHHIVFSQEQRFSFSPEQIVSYCFFPLVLTLPLQGYGFKSKGLRHGKDRNIIIYNNNQIGGISVPQLHLSAIHPDLSSCPCCEPADRILQWYAGSRPHQEGVSVTQHEVVFRLNAH